MSCPLPSASRIPKSTGQSRLHSDHTLGGFVFPAQSERRFLIGVALVAGPVDIMFSVYTRACDVNESEGISLLTRNLLLLFNWNILIKLFLCYNKNGMNLPIFINYYF